MTATRRLAAILAADVAGYSRLMGTDEEGTLTRLKMLRAELIDPAIASHHGRIFKTTGDGLLAEFSSVVEAVRCAVGWLAAMMQRAETRMKVRIGIHVGDAIVESEDMLGDGVNVAARLEGLAEPGGVCASARVHEDVTGRIDAEFACVVADRGMISADTITALEVSSRNTYWTARCCRSIPTAWRCTGGLPIMSTRFSRARGRATCRSKNWRRAG
jgi:class 3 adenylate cyclase